jgi:iron complex transport system ATP-binding protein
MSALSCSGIVVRRGGRAILDGIDMRANAGEFVAVIGANGAGKTTLLSVLAGLIAPDSGTVALDGTHLAAIGRTEIARRRAYLPQDPRCEWPISVERLIALGLTPVLPAFGGFPRKFQDRIDAMLKACDLTANRDQAATTLSSGERARAMLARALVGEPAILIADEPVAGLDPRHALDTAMRLRALAQSGRLVIASMHDLTLVARYATRVIALSDARIAADGPPASALDAALVRRVFDVDATLAETAGGPFVDYRAPATANWTQNPGVLDSTEGTPT